METDCGFENGGKCQWGKGQEHLGEVCKYAAMELMMVKTDCGEATQKTTQEQGKPKRKCSKDAVLDCSVGQRQDS